MNHDRFETHPVTPLAVSTGTAHVQCAHEDITGYRCKNVISMPTTRLVSAPPEQTFYCDKHVFQMYKEDL